MSAIFRQAFATRAIHHGYDPQQYLGALCPPVFMSSTFTFPTAEYGGACFEGTEPGYFYSRIANPTLNLLEQRIANLEGRSCGGVFLRYGRDYRLLLDTAQSGRRADR